MIRLDFSIQLEYQVLQPTEFEFIVHAAKSARQTVLREQFQTTPAVDASVETFAFFNNRHVRLHGEPGPLSMHYSALVDVDHYFVAPDQLREIPVADMPVEVLHYLRPSRYCPSDCFFQIAMQEFGGMSPGYGRVQAIADWVRNRTRFQVGTTNSFHCATDTLNNRVGVCRDFAHLMISLCRALNIPARYVTSIDYGADPALGPMDFHAYVEVFLSDRWFIVDPTGICTKTGLVRLATGRDANDVAFATTFGSVRWTMPKVNMIALGDTGAGIALPAPTDMAISTSESVAVKGANIDVNRSAVNARA